MGETAVSPETGIEDAFAVDFEHQDMQTAELDRERGRARRYALVGVGLYLLAWLLGGIGETQGVFALVPVADLSLSLGFVLALFAAVLAGAGFREIVPVGAIAGIGHFYKGQDHSTHVLSGLGLGLEHVPHILLGVVLMGVSIAIAVFVAFYYTRASTRIRRTQ